MTRDAYFHITRRREVKEKCLCERAERRPTSQWSLVGDVKVAWRRAWRCLNCGGTVETILHLARVA